MPAHKPQKHSARVLLVLLLATPTLYLLLLTNPPESSNAFLPTTRPHLTTFLNHLHPSVTSLHRLASVKPWLRADALNLALSAWRNANMPPPVLIAAAVCTPKLVANALFRGDVAGVIDVGAGSGHPITDTALKQHAKWVLSFEESAEYDRLQRLRGTEFHHVRARPGNGAQHPTLLQALQAANLTAHTHNRQDPSARLYGTISLLSVMLSRPHLVVEGAAALLPSVQNVLLRVDVEDHATESLQVLFQSGFECAHLAFSNKRKSHPFFGRNSVSSVSAPSFLQFVTKHGGVVHVLCSKRTST